jgi:hypothetical protein
LIPLTIMVSEQMLAQLVSPEGHALGNQWVVRLVKALDGGQTLVFEMVNDERQGD